MLGPGPAGDGNGHGQGQRHHTHDDAGQQVRQPLGPGIEARTIGFDGGDHGPRLAPRRRTPYCGNYGVGAALGNKRCVMIGPPMAVTITSTNTTLSMLASISGTPAALSV